MRLFDYNRASRLMEKAGIDIILVSTPQNVGYLADYYREVASEYDVLWDTTATHKTLVGLPKEKARGAFLVLGGHERTGVEIADPWIKDRRYWGPGYYIKNWTESDPDPGNPMNVAAEALVEKGLSDGCIAVNMRFLGTGYFERLRSLLPNARLVNGEPVMWELRRIKTPEEIRRIREACRRTCKAWLNVMKQRQIGMTEKGMRGLFIKAFAEEWLNEARIFCMFGPAPGHTLKNGSPLPSDNPLEEGMFSRVDVHGKFKGYTSDLSRAIAFGKMRPEMVEAHGLVKSMVQRLHEAIKPGLSGAQVRALELEMYDGTGYPPMIPYTGHNLGRAIHEPPFLREKEETVLEPGMVISVEPTIMYSARGGDIFVAIEDTVLITEDGCENLTADATWELYL